MAPAARSRAGPGAESAGQPVALVNRRLRLCVSMSCCPWRTSSPRPRRRSSSDVTNGPAAPPGPPSPSPPRPPRGGRRPSSSWPGRSAHPARGRIPSRTRRSRPRADRVPAARRCGPAAGRWRRTGGRICRLPPRRGCRTVWSSTRTRRPGHRSRSAVLRGVAAPGRLPRPRCPPALAARRPACFVAVALLRHDGQEFLARRCAAAPLRRAAGRLKAGGAGRPAPVVSGLRHPQDPGWAAGCGRSRPSRAAVPSTGTR